MRFRRTQNNGEASVPRSMRYTQFLRYAVVILGIGTVFGWGAWYVLSSAPANGVSAPMDKRATNPAVPASIPRTAEAKTSQDVYEEVEMALAQACNDLQVDPKQVKEKQPWLPLSGTAWQPSQRTIRVSAEYSLSQCDYVITRSLRNSGAQIIGATENTHAQELFLQIAVNGQIMGELTVTRDSALVKKRGKMAILIEDFGSASPDVAQRFLAVNRKLTFGLVPWKNRLEVILPQITQRKQEVIVQAPMEPYEYPEVSPGKRAVFVSQSELENRKVIRDALTAIPQAKGVMGYLGGRVLNNGTVIGSILDEISKQKRYFLDTQAGVTSLATSLATKAGLPNGRSWGELDPVDNQERIAMMLDLASFEALEKGHVIVTAHARLNTLTALLQRLERLETRGVELTPISSLLESAP